MRSDNDWIRLGEEACLLRDRLADALNYSFNQFGESAKETQSVNALYHSFARLRDLLNDAVASAYPTFQIVIGSEHVHIVHLFYGKRKLPQWDVGATLIKKPRCYTETQVMHLRQTCHDLSVFVEKIRLEKARRLIRRINTQIGRIVEKIQPEVNRILF